jgi:hypothetical protein
VIMGMLVSLSVMTAIETLPRWHATRAFWMRTIGTEIFWPWYTLIGVTVTVSTAGALLMFIKSKTQPPGVGDM